MGGDPVRPTTVPLPRKRESSIISCRPKGDSLSTGFPFPREWEGGRSCAPYHRTTPSKEGVQSNIVSPEGRLLVSLDSRFHGYGTVGDHVRPTTVPLPRKRESSLISCRPKGDSLSHWIPVSTGMGGGGDPVCSATVPLPRKWESSLISCRPQGDSLSHWIPVSTGMGGGRLREHRHHTTPTEVGVQSNIVSPEGRLLVYWIPVSTGMGRGGDPVCSATVPLPRKRESSLISCRPKGDSLSTGFPFPRVWDGGAILFALPPYHSLERGSPV